MFRAILVPLDGSAYAEAAVPYGRDEARGHGATLVLVYLIPRPEVAVPGLRHGGPVPDASAWTGPEADHARRAADRYLRDVADQYQLGPRTSMVVAVGDPYLRLVSEIERRQAPMLVTCPSTIPNGSPAGYAAWRIMQRGLAPVLCIQHLPPPVERAILPFDPVSYGEAFDAR